jgi:dipeptidyl aminopeptidase/acylaminoacyl peptidase
VKWGLVCIAPSYTHAAGSPQPAAPGTEGASEENLRRARQCLAILESLPYVDKQRLGAYGHSMGGFVTIGLAASEPTRLKAAAITGSGIAPRAGYPAPSTEQAAKIRTPFLMLHGSVDNVVRPSQSAALKEVLEKNQVPLDYHVFEGEGHPIDRTQGPEVYARMRRWFEKHGILKPAG